MSTRPARYTSLARCLRLARLLSERQDRPSVSEMAREIGVSERTVFRYLAVLAEVRDPMHGRRS